MMGKLRIKAAEKALSLVRQAEDASMTDAYDTERECRLCAEYLSRFATTNDTIEKLVNELRDREYDIQGADYDWPRKVRCAIRDLEGLRK